MGFTAFAMETGFAEAVKINDYVLGRVDEPERWQHNWFTWGWGYEQELLALVRWMRRYNENPQHTRKLRFYGIDVAVSYSSPLAAIEGALTYLDRIDPDYAAFARRQSVLPLVGKFRGSGGGDEARAVSLNKYKKLAVEERNAYAAAIADLVSRFETARVDYIRRSSEDEYEWAYHYAIAARQLDTAYRRAATEEKPDDHSRYDVERDRAMADNVLWVLQREGPSGRIVVWAHNAHIQKIRQWGEKVRLGLFLDSMLGRDYVSIGFTFYRGIQSSDWEESYRAPIVEPSQRGSLDGELAQIGLPMFILDLRTVPKGGPVYEWLNQVREMRWNGEYQPLNPIQAWDAIFYIHSISPAHEK
jgi:erythromycin esterase